MTIITLEDVLLNGQRIDGETTFTLQYPECVQPSMSGFYMEPEKHVTILPKGIYEGIYLDAVASTLIIRQTSTVIVNLMGVEKDHPWVKHEFELFLKEYETANVTNIIGYRQAKILFFGVKSHTKTSIEDLIPKVTLMVSEKEAAYMMALLVQDKPASEYVKMNTYLKDHIRKAIIEVRGDNHE